MSRSFLFSHIQHMYNFLTDMTQTTPTPQPTHTETQSSPVRKINCLAAIPHTRARLRAPGRRGSHDTTRWRGTPASRGLHLLPQTHTRSVALTIITAASTRHRTTHLGGVSLTRAGGAMPTDGNVLLTIAPRSSPRRERPTAAQSRRWLRRQRRRRLCGRLPGAAGARRVRSVDRLKVLKVLIAAR